MLFIYPFGENAQNELNKLDSQFLVENKVTLSSLSSFNEEIAKDENNLTAMFMDIDEIDVLNLDFSQFDVLLCKTKGEKDLSVLRKKQVVFEISDEHDLTLAIEILNYDFLDEENLIHVDFYDIRMTLLETKKMVMFDKTIHYDSLEDLNDKIDYFSQALKAKNIRSCNIFTYLVSSYDLELEATDMISRKMEDSVNELERIILGLSFDENFPNKTLRVILIVGVL